MHPCSIIDSAARRGDDPCRLGILLFTSLSFYPIIDKNEICFQKFSDYFSHNMVPDRQIYRKRPEKGFQRRLGVSAAVLRIHPVGCSGQERGIIAGGS
jgi:hypothetical protein